MDEYFSSENEGTLLHLAVKNGDFGMVKRIFANRNVDLSVKDEHGKTAIEYAKDVEILKFILNKVKTRTIVQPLDVPSSDADPELDAWMNGGQKNPYGIQNSWDGHGVDHKMDEYFGRIAPSAKTKFHPTLVQDDQLGRNRRYGIKNDWDGHGEDHGTNNYFGDLLNLYNAINENKLDDMKRILRSNPGIVNALIGPNHEYTALCLACNPRVDRTIFDFLMSMANIDVNTPMVQGMTPIMVAFDSQNSYAVTKLLKAGCQCD